MRSICLLLLFLSVNAVFVAPVKIYPFCFALFICAIAIWLFHTEQIGFLWRHCGAAWFGCLLYFLYFVVFFFLRGGDTTFVLRLFINVSFFLSASLFFLAMRRCGRGDTAARAVTAAFFVAILFSFIQAFINVARGGLWLLPASVTNSSDAYAIQSAGAVVFGDLNKNVWATKTLLFYLLFFALRRRRSSIWWGRDYLALLFTLFVVAYTCSRTAQLAFVFGFMGYFFAMRWRSLRFVGRFCLVSVVFAGMSCAVMYSRLSAIGQFGALNGNVDDGLVGRIKLWLYFLFASSDFSWTQIAFGHGVSAVTDFVSRAFPENNLHNVFLNQFFDLGLVGVALYCFFLLFFFKSLEGRWRWLFVPALFLIMNSQYFGFDPELMVLFATGVLLIKHRSYRDELMASLLKSKRRFETLGTAAPAPKLTVPRSSPAPRLAEN